MKQQTRRMVVRVEEETGDILVTQGDADEEGGKEELEAEYTGWTVRRIRSRQLDKLPCIFWRLTK